MLVHLTLKSSNRKTGPIPVSTTQSTSCPTSCALREVCYAKGGPLAIHWRKLDNGVTGTDFGKFCETIASLPEDQLWRHNQAGDLPGVGDALDRRMLRQLVRANVGRRGFTYTHKPPTDRVVRAIAAANLRGFTINLSGNNLEHADTLAETGLPTVTVLGPVEPGIKTVQTPQGRTVVVCPATYNESVSCATCQLCARSKRSIIVGFPVHGSKKNQYKHTGSESHAIEGGK